MSSILLFCQHTKGKVAKPSLVALQAALQLKDSWKKSGIVGVVLGSGASTAADTLLGYGISKVFFSENEAFDKYLAPQYVAALSEAGKLGGADTFVGASTSTAKDFFPRFAAISDAAQASDIIAVNADGSLKRPMYAGDVFADVELTTPIRVVTVRTSAFQPAEQNSAGGSKQEFSVTLPTGNIGSVVSYDISAGGRPELSDAAVVVSGGRALKSSETFMQYIAPLADAFGGAIGASRAAVDSGYAPNDWQVGQTGKIVAPNLYVAVGISGAIQHLAGMKDSKVIVAINKDGDAPIFEVADFGLVADLYDAVPKLTDAVKKAKAT